MLLPFNTCELYPFSSGMSMPMARHFLLFRLFFQEGDLHQGLPGTRKVHGPRRHSSFQSFQFDLRHLIPFDSAKGPAATRWLSGAEAVTALAGATCRALHPGPDADLGRGRFPGAGLFRW